MITPGNWGFAATAFVVLLTIFLIIDMVRRLRRMRYRAQVEESRGGAHETGAAEETGAGERSEPSPEDSDPQAPGRGRANGRP